MRSGERAPETLPYGRLEIRSGGHWRPKAVRQVETAAETIRGPQWSNFGLSPARERDRVPDRRRSESDASVREIAIRARDSGLGEAPARVFGV